MNVRILILKTYTYTCVPDTDTVISKLQLNLIRNNITRSLNIQETNKIDVSYCLLSNIWAVLPKSRRLKALHSKMLYFCYVPARFISPVTAGLQISAGHRKMTDRNKCLTDLKLLQSAIVSERKIKTKMKYLYNVSV